MPALSQDVVADLKQENARLSAELRAAREHQNASADILRTIADASGDAERALKQIAETSARLFDAADVQIQLAEDGEWGRGFRFGTSARHVRSAAPLEAIRVGGRNLPDAVIGDNRQIHIPDLDRPDPSVADFVGIPRARAAGTRTICGTPLRREGRAVGVLVVYRDRLSPFSDEELALQQSFADQAVIAIENARLFKEVGQRTRDLTESLQQQTATAEVLKVITRSTFNLQAVLDTLVESATLLCEAQGALIHLPSGNVYRAAARYGYSRENLEYFESHPISIDRGSVVGRTVIDKQIVHIADVLADPGYTRHDAQTVAGYRTALGVPLLREAEVVGVIFLARIRPQPFTQKQIELVATFADQAVIAIENARLFEELQAKTRDLQEALTYQTGSANILKVIASSPTDVGPVLKAIVESACELCEAYDALLVLKSGADLVVSAHRGPIPVNRQRWVNDRDSVSGRSIADGAPVHLHDVLSDEGAEFPAAQQLSRRDGVHTLLGVPLLREGEGIGAIVLRRTEVNPFSDKQITLLQTFANQAVIALGNVRLFEEVQERTRELSESLEQQTATSEVLEIISASSGDLEPVFQKMLENATRICGASFGEMTMYEPGGFRSVALYNVPEACRSAQLHLLIEPHPQSGLSMIERTHHAVQIEDLRTQPPYRDGHPNVRALADLGGARSLVIVPMLKEGELIGTITIFRQEVKPFTAKQTELVANFANQAVIAIENARLLNELRERTRQLSQSLDDLRTAQDRLIQTEKLASLGQLTAGIAHEIKNPLNFVNNFSSLSSELIDELSETLRSAGLDETARQGVDELTQMLQGNLEKIVHHGKRADSIVKNMLMHSRQGSGERRPTDINAIVEESLNLAYHGARAEKPGFNITLERSLDPAAGTINLYPQEIARVFLNLISNGFYAATKRREIAGDGFEPTLSATTRSLGGGVEIRIRDNGTGIPAEVREKIFDPFFTTKPAGDGTGLGLSICHDIIVKQHGGRIAVDTAPGDFTEFIITLPRAAAAQTQTGGKS
ncbi:GAF domain-containing protein [Bradyrhizobium erythrophlei]|uniref:GAF domain-containing protein n=1 Tax=Bradyrhizobium erythrophlei TaxID=1437360 RepID=UPI0035E809CA